MCWISEQDDTGSTLSSEGSFALVTGDPDRLEVVELKALPNVGQMDSGGTTGQELSLAAVLQSTVHTLYLVCSLVNLSQACTPIVRFHIGPALSESPVATVKHCVGSVLRWIK